MLSPGDYHKRVPKDYLGNLRFRANVLKLCREEPKYREAVKEACRRDVLFFINTFCFTFRPKAAGDEPKVVPFITWPSQDEAIRFVVDRIDRQEPFVAEKSRDEGWSWICCLVADWHWRFHEYVKVGLFSRVAELVDSKNPDSLFWKVRFVQKWLPEWMWPKGFQARLHDTEMYRENPETGSVITGQATTKDMGVAGRCTWAVFDEFSRVPNAQVVLDNTKDTSDCRGFVSTHTGPGTAFHGLCTNGVTRKFVSHWSQHPRKNRGLYRYHPERHAPYDVEVLDKSYPFPPDYPFVRDGTPAGGPFPCLRSPWYDEECRQRSRADVRTNLDIDVAGSTLQFFSATLIRELVRQHARDPAWRGDVIVDQQRGVSMGLLTLPEGPLKLWVKPGFEDAFPPGSYAVGADIAQGTGATPSCASVVNRETGEKVAEYTNRHIIPERFAALVACLGRLFPDRSGREAKVSWEADGSVGQAFGKAIMGLGYRHVYYRLKPLSYAGLRGETDTPGWYGQGEEKTIVLMSYATALEKRKFVNPSEDALLECLVFQWDENGRVHHPKERNPTDLSGKGLNHADHVIADAQAWMLCEPLLAGRELAPAAKEPPAGSWAWRRELQLAADRAAGDEVWAT